MDVISNLLVAASDEEKTELLQHPLIGAKGIAVITLSMNFSFAELYLSLKWSRVAFFFYLWIFAYVVFVFSMSVYVTLLTRDVQEFDKVIAVSRCMLIISASCLLAHAILQVLIFI